jgi:hypothetical protein
MEYRVWIRAPDGGFDVRYVEKEEWRTQAEIRRVEELDAKKQGKFYFGSTGISVGIYEEGKPQLKKKVPITEVVRANPIEQDGMGDMTGLTFLEEATMLHNMRFRFAKDNIYTNINKVICATNPYQWLEIYSENEMSKYRGARLEALPPHIFATSERAYQALKRGKNQSMICCGESGSGKTESTKLLMKYLATANKGTPHESKSDLTVQAKVLDANPILETFGNASTLMNNNSSRFAKFTKLYFDENFCLVSADIVTYLLEKSRVVNAPRGTRAFHSFYQLFHLPDKYKSSIKVNLHVADKKMTDFAYIKNNIQLGKIDDAQFALEMLDGMSTLGFTTDERDSILRTLSGILHLGNVQPFEKKGYEPSTDLKLAAGLLGVPNDALIHALTTKEITTRAETILKPRDPADFVANRDTMSKALYHGIFELVVVCINRAFKGGKSKSGAWIGVLDVFGFEHFEHNSFEQLCINFCNEKLQQFFNSYIIMSEQEEYEKEGIQWTTLDSRDRQGCLRLFEDAAPPGIYPLLDSANAQSQDHKRYLATLVSQHRYNRFLFIPQAQASRFQTAEEKAKQDLLTVSFGVKHYAANVIYDTSELLTKNADKIDTATITLFTASKVPLIAGLLANADPAKKKESVGTYFCNQLTELYKTLNATEPHFVRCINPNNRKQKQAFDLAYVSPQLVNGGLVEAVRMLKLGYPTRYQYGLFFDAFKPLLKVIQDSKEEFTPDGRYYAKKCTIVKSKDNHPHYINVHDFCEGVLKAFGLQREQYQCGISKIFFRAGLQELVEEVLSKTKNLDNVTPKHIKTLEKWLTYKRMLRLSGCSKFLGRLWLFTKRTSAARKLQLAARSINYWEDRVNWKENRKKAAAKLGRFWLWCKCDRQLLFMQKKVVGKIVDQIRQEKAAEEARRLQEKNRTPAHVLADLALWIESILKRPVISSLIPALRSGELVCDLIMTINKDVVIDGVHRDKRQLFFARDNLQKAQKGLMQMRCPSNNLFSADDLLSTVQQNHKKVVTTLQWLASMSYLKFDIPLPKYLQAKLEAGGDLNEEEVEEDQDDGKGKLGKGGGKKFQMDADDSDEEMEAEAGTIREMKEEDLKKLDEADGAFSVTARAAAGGGGGGGGGGASYSYSYTSASSGGILSVAKDPKEILSDLQRDYKKFCLALIGGSKFRQYESGKKVMKRYLRLLPPKGMANDQDLKDVPFEAILENPSLRLALSSKTTLISMINVADIVAVYAGKRDSGKCFPASDGKVADDSIAPEDKCFVIVTKKRTVGLEAKSKFLRDFWVAGLEWCVAVVRTTTQADEDKKAAGDVMAGMELDPMLLEGLQFTKHGLKGVTRRFIKCSPTHIYWLKKKESPLDECCDPIGWDSVSEILQGKQTLMFSRARAKNVQDSLCFSIVYRSDNRTLDLVADNEAQAFEWYGALNGYLMELKERFAQAARGTVSDKEVEAIKQTLESERQIHAKEKQQTQEELEKVRARRASLTQKIESKESEMERMKAMMAEERDQLVARIKDLHDQVKDLTSQLDTALTEKQELLVQLQDARKDKAELAALRAEIKRIRESRAAQANEISGLLASFTNKFGSFQQGLQAVKADK